MSPLSIVILGFVVLESMNVLALYFFPGSRYANSVGVFKAWERSKADPEVHDLVRYLVDWVAGTKLIFLALLLVILLTADTQGPLYTGLALAISISSFFWRLFPLARKIWPCIDAPSSTATATLSPAWRLRRTLGASTAR